jgi:hypothetical protein
MKIKNFVLLIFRNLPSLHKKNPATDGKGGVDFKIHAFHVRRQFNANF